MEFWGTEVAPGKPLVCHPGDEMYCHVSQVALGPASEGKSERVVLRVETGDKNIVLGTLCSGKCDQMALDLIFDREFKLSHTGTSSSVYFCGYKTEKGEPEDFDSEEDEDEESEDEEMPLAVTGGAIRIDPAAVPLKAKASKSPKKAKVVDDEADEGDDSDEDDDDEDDSDLDDSDELDEDDDEDDSDEDDESEDEEMVTPEASKKRPLKEAEAKSLSNGNKKARVDTPAKPGLADRKVHKSATAVSTPAKAQTPEGKKKDDKEAKKEQKTPQKTPGKEDSVKTPKGSKSPSTKSEAGSTPGTGKKGVGPHKCEACNRAFATESAHSQHMTAKHGKSPYFAIVPTKTCEFDVVSGERVYLPLSSWSVEVIHNGCILGTYVSRRVGNGCTQKENGRCFPIFAIHSKSFERASSVSV
ncbi:hypothetical protein R1sor_008055 [Riccia sorocarpa]|uniref:C2H2-type domain-containing protein n=1 Tax=Riccia sorocarpa TaxID=122646 RepID=A0ABD3HUJ3_9MARC